MFVRRAFWKSDWFLGFGLTLLFFMGYTSDSTFIRNLEFGMYDAGLAASATQADNRIVILDIDDESIDLIGRWPWSRNVMADMIDTLSQAQVRMVGVDVFYSEQQSKSAGDAAIRLAKLLQEQGDSLLKEADGLVAEGRGKDAEPIFSQADQKFMQADEVMEKAAADNGDARLVQAVAKAGNVFMPMFYEEGEVFGRPDAELPAYISRMGIDSIGSTALTALPVSAVKLSYPFKALAQASAGIGYLNVRPSAIDGTLRSGPVVVEYYGQFFPSMSLVMAAHDLNLSMEDILINVGSSVKLGSLNIPTDQYMQISPSFYTDANGGKDKPFRHISFYDLKTGKVSLALLKDKIVLVGVTANGIGEPYNTPVLPRMNAIDYHANVLESLLLSNLISMPEWADIAELSLFLLIGLYLIFMLPRLSAIAGTMITALLLLLVVGTAYFLLAENKWWVEVMTSSSLLIVGYMLLTIKRFFSSEEDRLKISSESIETNKMLALSFQSQGMLDMAFDKFKKCPPTDDILGALYTLALDFERKRQFNKAAAVYEYILESNANFKDVKKRLERTRDAGESIVFGGAGNGAMGTLMITGGAKPTLGRYEIVKEIGKGAMGTVYLGKDPKINREVAIKTMALSQEFDGDELKDVKERFFREAETAGMLNHPNIVTMFDAGEEHDLAFIAMEYLDGTDLAPYTKKGKLLPQMATLKIVGKVAEALHYASEQRVVHRDIKPANIMLLKDKTVKVTDFGIARITASSKTKTGIVLGTPSYMSPEQLSGKHVDGRSDIFSLGVMLYELLVGSRPFKGDSMATLLFQIANEPHPDVREYDATLPEHVSKLINAMLEKNPDKRLPNGAAVIRGIIACLKVMAVEDSKK